MNHDELERSIRSALKARAEQAPVELQPTSVRAKRREHRRTFVIATVAALVVVVAAVVTSGANDTVIVASDSNSSMTTSSTIAGNPPPGHYLAFDTPGFRYRRVENQGCRSASPEAASSPRLDTFGTSYFESPIIFVQTVAPSGSFGLLDARSGDPVTVRGVPGWARLDRGPDRGWAMSAVLPDGGAIYVTVLGMDPSTAIGVVDALERQTDGGWDLPSSSSGLRRLEPTTPQPGCGYSAQSEGFEVNLYVDAFDRRLQDRISSTVGPAEPVVLGTLPAVIGDYRADDHWVMAEPAPGLTLEIRAGGMTREQVLELISHARFVDQAGWQAVHPPNGDAHPSGTAVPATRP